MPSNDNGAELGKPTEIGRRAPLDADQPRESDPRHVLGAELREIEDDLRTPHAGVGAAVTAEPREQTMLEQMGGFSGLIYSTLPVLVFVPINTIWGLTAAIWSALGVAAAILAWRLFRRSPVQPAISGFLGVGICAFIAYRMGEAKGFFLFGIYTSLVYAGAFLISILVRWPLVGIIWGFLNGHGKEWRGDRRVIRLYDIATATWVLVFGARYLVQSSLYDTDHTGWLAFARIAMGWPLTAVAFGVTVWAVRRAGHMPVKG